MSSPPRASGVVKDCVKNCIQYTYYFLYSNCDEVYKRESKIASQPQVENSSEQNEETVQNTTVTTSTIPGTNLKSLTYWHQLMYLLTCIISEDRERYSLVLNQLVSISA